jgi:hypothetical protein
MEKITNNLHQIVEKVLADKPLYSQENVKDKIFYLTIKEFFGR